MLMRTVESKGIYETNGSKQSMHIMRSTSSSGQKSKRLVSMLMRIVESKGICETDGSKKSMHIMRSTSKFWSEEQEVGVHADAHNGVKGNLRQQVSAESRRE
jgi:hypothetical protein